jgi:hypothetical protein
MLWSIRPYPIRDLGWQAGLTCCSAELVGGCPLLHLFVDANACTVKQDIYRVAKRYDLADTLVAGS